MTTKTPEPFLGPLPAIWTASDRGGAHGQMIYFAGRVQLTLPTGTREEKGKIHQHNESWTGVVVGLDPTRWLVAVDLDTDGNVRKYSADTATEGLGGLGIVWVTPGRLDVLEFHTRFRELPLELPVVARCDAPHPAWTPISTSGSNPTLKCCNDHRVCQGERVWA